MIKHIVMWKLHGSALGRSKEENAKTLQEKLELLPSQIQGIRNWEVGINVAESDTAYDVVLVSEFRDREALKRYRQHREHQKLITDYLSFVRSAKIVVDYEV